MAAPTGYTAGQMTVDDTFSGTSLDSSDWTPQVAPGSVWNDEDLPAGDSSAGSNQAAYWTPGQVSVDNGLTLTARQTIPSDAGSSKGFNWVSGAITSKFTLPSTGWYVQIRAQMPDTSDGMWPALWFLPSSSAQEFDGLEGGWPGSSPNEQGHSDLFDSSGQDQAVWPTPGGTDITSGYNTYGFRYIPGQSATVYFNGQQVYQDSDSNISSEAYYLIIELQVASSATSGWHTALSANTPSPSNMNISEVRPIPAMTQIWSTHDTPSWSLTAPLRADSIVRPFGERHSWPTGNPAEPRLGAGQRPGGPGRAGGAKVPASARVPLLREGTSSGGRVGCREFVSCNSGQTCQC
jgi:hypothetical protein